ncbi:uncharacterized protein LOC119079231 [Bradysia coprophila]|uniref:uncharacterized protein LOC119079231 n=1 Tax=Bradysia coprophila TaxID=38358 RepID=UPI00187D9CE6|nr:uncharacterized protein LOC119079231 [Bradysia coprophila]
MASKYVFLSLLIFNVAVNGNNIDSYNSIYGNEQEEQRASSYCQNIKFGSLHKEAERIAVTSCCRDHIDQCTDEIPVSNIKHGLHNREQYVIRNCECSKKYIKCLKELDNSAAQNSYIAYISDIHICFAISLPIKRCVMSDFIRRCRSYELMDGIAKYQFFDQYLITDGGVDDGVLGSGSTGPQADEINAYDAEFTYPNLFPLCKPHQLGQEDWQLASRC